MDNEVMWVGFGPRDLEKSEFAEMVARLPLDGTRSHAGTAVMLVRHQRLQSGDLISLRRNDKLEGFGIRVLTEEDGRTFLPALRELFLDLGMPGTANLHAMYSGNPEPRQIRVA